MADPDVVDTVHQPSQTAGRVVPKPLIDEISYRRGHRYALWKNPEDLTDRQAAKLVWIATHNHRLYRAYLLEEQLRLVFQHPGDEAIAMLDARLEWARRCQIPAFVELYHRIKKNRAGIIASVLASAELLRQRANS